MRFSRQVVTLALAVVGCGGGGGGAPDAGGRDAADPDATVPACVGAADCDDGQICTEDRCANGFCVHDDDDSAVPDDGAACTVDTCADGAPVFTPDDVACDDASGTCVVEQCDPANQNTDDGSGCRVALDDLACGDGNPCTDDLCDPTASGADPVTGCDAVPNTAEPTPIPGNCQEEICAGGDVDAVDDPTDVPTADSDGFACTAPACSATSPSAPIEVADDGNCDDGLLCTLDICDPTDTGAGADGCAVLADDAGCGAGEACDPTADPAQNPSGCVSVDTCPATLAIADGEVFSYSTTGLTDDATTSCAAGTGAHPDVAFELVLAEDSDVLIALHPTDGHPVSVALIEVTAATCGRELLCDVAASGDADLAVLNLAAGTYAIVVDGTGTTASAGTFTLAVLTDATAIGAGDLILNELLANPRTLSDSNAEFLEIANPSSSFAVGTSGLTLIEDDGTPVTQTLLGAAGEQLVVAAGDFLIGTPSPTPSLNGGLIPDFDLVHGLNNTPNENLRIVKDATLIDEVDLVAGGFPAATDGTSVQLDRLKKDETLNGQFSNWCLTPTSVYDAVNSNKGTPGGENELCSAPACTVPNQAVDCNDNNACTDDVCVTGACQNQNDDTNAPVSDGFTCTGETCVNGSTVVTPDDLACDDAVGCTVDDCVGAGGAPTTGCAFLPDDAVCSPGESCDPVDDCQPTTANPAVTGVNMLVIARGARLVLTGSAFTGATSVTIGGQAQTFVEDSSTQITIASVSDATPIAAQSVVVTTPVGSSAAVTITMIRLLISELDSDSVGTDDREFIEISTGVAGVNLTGYSLVLWNGATDLSYLALDLAGTTDASGMLLIGNAGVTPAPAVTFAINTLQNGPDAVGIYQAAPVAVNAPVTAVGLIDALVYETTDADDGGLLDTLLGLAGAPQRVQVDEGLGGAGNSAETNAIARCELGHRRDGRSYAAVASTPGVLPSADTCGF